MKLHDVVAVVGLKNRGTEQAEAMCRSMGIEVFHAMAASDANRRVESLEEAAVVAEPFGAVADNVFRLGLMVPEALAEEVLDCNLTHEREMFGHLIGWLLHRISAESDLPEGWLVLDDATDYSIVSYPKGTVLSEGRVVINWGEGNRLMQLPSQYREFFSAMEGFHL